MSVPDYTALSRKENDPGVRKKTVCPKGNCVSRTLHTFLDHIQSQHKMFSQYDCDGLDFNGIPVSEGGSCRPHYYDKQAYEGFVDRRKKAINYLFFLIVLSVLFVLFVLFVCRK